MRKLTPWFPGDVKPVRSGVYERDWNPSWPNECHFSDFWDGRSWWLYSVRTGTVRERFPVCHQSKPWRGLTKEAK